MKKNNLIIGITELSIGLIALVAAVLFDTRLEAMMIGLAGGMIGCGLMLTGKYLYWSHPKNKNSLREKLEYERIELHDELKEKVRDRAGRYAYCVGICGISVLMVAICVLGQLGFVENWNLFVVILGIYFVFQLCIGDVIFRRLMKKY